MLQSLVGKAPVWEEDKGKREGSSECVLRVKATMLTNGF